MKKLLLLVALFVGVVSSSSAQSFDSSSRYVGLSVGLFSGIGAPISITYEQAVTDDIGVGALLGWSSYRENSVGYTNVLLGARGNYHFLDNAKFDVYAGLILAYNAASYSSGGLIFGGQVGGRYLFNDRFAAVAEIGYGLGLITLGATYSF
ncbi:MAG: hypothetical protein SNG02_03310 [Rikenellaceae bacterium]